jgi:hypothetical protein
VLSTCCQLLSNRCENVVGLLTTTVLEARRAGVCTINGHLGSGLSSSRDSRRSTPMGVGRVSPWYSRGVTPRLASYFLTDARTRQGCHTVSRPCYDRVRTVHTACTPPTRAGQLGLTVIGKNDRRIAHLTRGEAPHGPEPLVCNLRSRSSSCIRSVESKSHEKEL